MTASQFAGLLGFAFAAVWAAAGFGDALLSIFFAGICWAGSAFYRGELDLVALAERASEYRRPPTRR